MNLAQKPDVLEPRESRAVASADLEMQRALHFPIGTRELKEIVSPGEKVAIVVNDITRPMPSDRVVPMLLEEICSANIPTRDIAVVIATGVHRPCSEDELSQMLGKVVTDKIRVENHDCKKMEHLTNLGKTRRGVPVVVNKTVAEADVKILTGLISPHQVAGYSGGRKSIMPGVAGLDSLKVHHSEKFRPVGPAMGFLDGNQFHEEAEEAAKIAEADFIVNVVLNSRRQLVKAVAGDLEKAWLAGVSASEDMYRVDIRGQVDIAVASPGGYPKDIDLWQSQKAISPAEMIVRQGGTIILVGECPEGFGEHTFSKFFEGRSPRDVINEFNRKGYEPGLSKAFMYARALERAELILVTSNISDADLAKVHTKRASSIDEALKMATERLGRDAQIAVMPHATEIVPRVREG